MSESDAARKNAINAWKSFPCSVRNDSSFSTFRNQLKCEDSSESGIYLKKSDQFVTKI